jgi:hypothetical protein
MTGAELRRIMKLRRIRTAEAAYALGIHPQTIRNLWAKDEVPRIYILALTSYVWVLGLDPSDWAPARDILTDKSIRDFKAKKPPPPPSETEERGVKLPGVPVAKTIEKREDPWTRLK